MFLCAVSCSEKPHEFSKDVNRENNKDDDEKEKQKGLVRTAHPRLFITTDDIPTMRENASGDRKASYVAMKSRIDNLIATGISFPDPLAKSGEYNTNHEIGFRAVEAATIWLVSGDRTYLEHTKTILKELTAYYQLRVKNNLNIAWYVYSQVCALCAYDWIYNDLTPEERKTYGEPLYNVMYDIAWHGSGVRKSRYRENISESTSGCYGINALPWFLSIAFYGDGVNDKKCEEMFKSGYDYFMDMAAFRRKMAGSKGGGATACAQYSFGFYPLADFNFIYTYKSATGVDLSEQFDYVLKYLDYLDWIRLPENKEYGFGDVHHNNCKLPHTDINYHLTEIANLYGGKHPNILPRIGRLLTQYSSSRPIDTFPFIRLLHKVKPDSVGEGSGTSASSIYFDTMGQVYMRSGAGDNDTYALFVSGGIPTNHKHYDNNHFIIYKNGYRALDSGTRPEPGIHLSHYFCRTVAHNCVTIKMPNETFPKYWGEIAPGETSVAVPNDGGQTALLGSKLMDLKETADYVYLASDATSAYTIDKTHLVMREMVYCKPDIFVIFDRVNSTSASYPKTWLFHTAGEPTINKKEFTESSQGGKTICRTLLPEDAQITKIGGPGNQFISDGRNWPIPAEHASSVPDNEWPLVGQWRIEVTPGEARTDDIFLHILQVGDSSLTALPGTIVTNNDRRAGVEFTYLGKKFKIDFDKTAVNEYGCNIEVTK